MRAITDTGIFEMSDTAAVLSAPSLPLAKAYAVDKIDAASNVKPENISKARAMVSKAKSQQSLALAISNFILSFQGLKVAK